MPSIKTTRATLKRLRNIRIVNCISQEHLARGLGINRTTYIRKEQGAIPITTEEWLKIAVILDEDAAYFFNSNKEGYTMVSANEPERLLLKLYRTLTPEEQQDIRNSLRLMLKGIKRKKVKDAVEVLMKSS